MSEYLFYPHSNVGGRDVDAGHTPLCGSPWPMLFPCKTALVKQVPTSQTTGERCNCHYFSNRFYLRLQTSTSTKEEKTTFATCIVTERLQSFFVFGSHLRMLPVAPSSCILKTALDPGRGTSHVSPGGMGEGPLVYNCRLPTVVSAEKWACPRSSSHHGLQTPGRLTHSLPPSPKIEAPADALRPVPGSGSQVVNWTDAKHRLCN